LVPIARVTSRVTACFANGLICMLCQEGIYKKVGLSTLGGGGGVVGGGD